MQWHCFIPSSHFDSQKGRSKPILSKLGINKEISGSIPDQISSGFRYDDIRSSWYARMFNNLEWLYFMTKFLHHEGIRPLNANVRLILGAQSPTLAVC